MRFHGEKILFAQAEIWTHDLPTHGALPWLWPSLQPYAILLYSPWPKLVASTWGATDGHKQAPLDLTISISKACVGVQLLCLQPCATEAAWLYFSSKSLNL